MNDEDGRFHSIEEQISNIVQDGIARDDRLADLENVVYHKTAGKVQHNSEELRRDRRRLEALILALAAMGFCYLGLSAESRQKLSEEWFGKIGSLVLGVGSGYLLLQQKSEAK